MGDPVSASQTFGAYAGGAATVIAGVFGGLVASPLLERLKARLALKDKSITTKAELVARLRMALGYLDAFTELVNRAIISQTSSTIEMFSDERLHWRQMQSFDLSPVKPLLVDLTRFGLEQSSTSAAGQVLTVIAHAIFKREFTRLG